MEILRRNLAPIPAAAWEEIDEQAVISLKQFLSARKIVDIEGPKGWDLVSVPTGKMSLEKTGKDATLCFGIRKSIPVLEPRVSFTLNKWELDNLSRGAKDIDLSPLEEAAKKIAQFEEDVIYKGLKKASIKGLLESAETSMALPTENSKWLETIVKGVYHLKESAIEGPYALVLSPDLWQAYNSLTGSCCAVKEQFADVLQGPVVLSHFINTGLLVSLRGGDFELTLGSDYSIGYENATNEEVTLYLTESFTFQIFEPNAIIKLNK